MEEKIDVDGITDMDLANELYELMKPYKLEENEVTVPMMVEQYGLDRNKLYHFLTSMVHKGIMTKRSEIVNHRNVVVYKLCPGKGKEDIIKQWNLRNRTMGREDE